MRLIDADDLIEVLTKYKFGAISSDSEREYVKDTMLNFVADQPTVYDIDKVVEEFEEIVNPKEPHFCRVSKGRCIHDEDDIGCIDCLSKKAIEIVKQGGVSDDVCEWKLEDDNLMTGCGDYFNLYDNCTDKFKHCPRCGKKINVVE